MSDELKHIRAAALAAPPAAPTDTPLSEIWFAGYEAGKARALAGAVPAPFDASMQGLPEIVHNSGGAVPAPVEPPPEGCTPADARMLRVANHVLADENTALRAALAAFVPAQIEMACDECGADEALCPSACPVRKARALLADPLAAVPAPVLPPDAPNPLGVAATRPGSPLRSSISTAIPNAKTLEQLVGLHDDAASALVQFSAMKNSGSDSPGTLLLTGHRKAEWAKARNALILALMDSLGIPR